jgi:hypothetical protein
MSFSLGIANDYFIWKEGSNFLGIIRTLALWKSTRNKALQET